MQELVLEKIRESLDQLMAFSLKRCDKREEAEDLCQEILLELVKSQEKLKSIDAYYGWMWQIANNVFNSQLRKKYKLSELALLEIHGSASIEETLVDQESLGLLYRELSILSKNYRESMCAYYLKGQSCKTIAKQLEISEEQVKQYLFKSRKKVKDGYGALRELGVRSVEPRPFKIHFFGKGQNSQSELFKRKAPGNILLECYYEQRSVESLSLELGISAVYLEDELKLLVENDLLKPSKKEGYQTNLIIFTEMFEGEFKNLSSALLKQMTDDIKRFYEENESHLKQWFSQGNTNTEKWQFLGLMLYDLFLESYLEVKLRDYPELYNGMSGYRWGLEKKYGDSPFDFGVLGHKNRQGDFMLCMNYFITNNRHRAYTEKETAEVILKALFDNEWVGTPEEEAVLLGLYESHVLFKKNNEVCSQIPVFTNVQLKAFKTFLEPLKGVLHGYADEITEIATRLLANHVPPYLKADTRPIAMLKQVEGTIEGLLRNLYEEQWIVKPHSEEDVVSIFALQSESKTH